MKKIISIFLTLIMAISAMTIGVSTTSAATTTSVNGRAASVNGIVYVYYQMKAPEKMEDIQVTVKYSKGLQLLATSYSSKMKTGSFIHNEKLSNEIRFNSICLAKPMDFRTKTSIIGMKFKVTSSGRKYTSFDLQCLDGVSGKAYGKTQNTSNYKKLSFTKLTKVMATSVKLNRTGVTLNRGRAYQLRATVYPAGASKSVKWTTTNKRVATVSSNGRIYAKGKGACYITCQANDGSRKYRRCKVVVR